MVIGRCWNWKISIEKFGSFFIVFNDYKNCKIKSKYLIIVFFFRRSEIVKLEIE